MFIDSGDEIYPKIECLLFKYGAYSKVMKNWLPLVLSPAFAILKIPGLS